MSFGLSPVPTNGPDLINGTFGNDTLIGGDGNDTLISFAGLDRLFGNFGNDILSGGADADRLFGHEGADNLFGEVGADWLFGGSSNDSLYGGEGNDHLNGGSGNDILSGGAGRDALQGSAGNDRIGGGDGNDRLDGGSGRDALSGGRGRDILRGGTGNDRLSGGDGNDRVEGGAGNDRLFGGDGNDTVAGGNGNDVAFLGAGEDIFTWNPGDGSDVVEGQDEDDTLDFNGSDVGETITISASGTRVLLFRDINGDTMDLSGVETISFDALGGMDNINVGDLSETDVANVEINLAVVLGGSGGDGERDIVTVDGTADADTIVLASDQPGEVTVSSISAEVRIVNAEGANDTLVIAAGADDDVVNAIGFAAGEILLEIQGGDGDDVLIGSEGSDTVSGGTGDDLALLGEGSDVFVWNHGDGSDSVTGGDGDDMLDFNGSEASETIAISAAGSAVSLSRDIDDVTLDLSGTETIRFDGFAGDDVVTVEDDLLDTDVTAILVNGGDGNDSLTGGTSAEVLDGGAGADELAGEGGADTFVFGTSPGSGNVDTITDFTQGSDVIRLSSTVFTGLAAGVLPGEAFRIGEEATEADDRIIYDPTSGELFFDADGAGGATQIQFARLNEAPDLAASDFFVV
jgi:Ca2+-binding RTX toxin-like protein